MRSDVCTSRVTFPPKSQPAPRGLTAHVSISSGSDHMRSTVRGKRDAQASKAQRDEPQKAPSCGISWARDKTRI